MKYAKWRQRLRGTCKWGGVTLCVLLFALWLASGWWMILYETRAYVQRGVGTMNQPHVSLTIVFGRIVFFVDHTPRLGSAASIYGCYSNNPLWEQPRWDWWWEWLETPMTDTLEIPLWLPFLLIALPTGFLFWSDHRRRLRVGCCAQCGYNLTGNTSGKCPECGATTIARAASS